MISYVRKHARSLIFRFLILLVLPIFSGGYFILYNYNLFNFHDLSSYHINSIFIIFVLIGLLPILLNLGYYLNDTHELVYNYKGQNKKIKNINVISFWGIILLGAIISVFVVLIIIKYLNFHQIVEFNRYLSLFIFFVFLVIDCLTWWSETIEKNEETEQKHKDIHDLNISFSKDSTFLINIPTFFIIFLSILFVHKLETLEYYFQFTDSNHFLYPVHINEKKEIIDLFIVGLETGIIMTSIVFSQIIFYIIKIKWSYGIYKLQTKNDNIKSILEDTGKSTGA